MSEPSHSTARPQVVVHEWVRLLFGVLHHLGLTDVVISPGSRNAPLVYGALGHPELCCHSVLDERVAGFFALGLARSQRRPVALVCTSGSALGHYLPALIEAWHAQIPLLVLSADRPAHLQNSGSAQTIRQSEIFGAFAQTLPGWDEPSAEPRVLAHWARKVEQIYRLTQSPRPGPAHLDLPFDKPLEPASPELPPEIGLRDLVDRLIDGTRPADVARMSAPEPSLRAFLRDFLDDMRPACLTVGPTEPHLSAKIMCLSTKLGVPLISENPGMPTAVPADAWAYRMLQSSQRPAIRVLHLGPPLVSSHFAALLEQPDVAQWIACGTSYLDPSGRARQVLVADLEATLDSWLEQSMGEVSCLPLPMTQHSPDRDLEQSDAACDPELLSEPRAVSCFLNMVPPRSSLLLGNSLSIRLAGWVRRAEGLAECRVFSARGANGIDGLIAQAAGIARAESRPTAVCLGDVAAAHDLGSLAVARAVTTPLIVFVLDNDGGHIFDHLPGAKLWGQYPGARDYFVTPPGLDFRAVGAAIQIPVEECQSLPALGRALRAGFRRPGASLVVAKTDPRSTRAFLDSMRDPK